MMLFSEWSPSILSIRARKEKESLIDETITGISLTQIAIDYSQRS